MPKCIQNEYRTSVFNCHDRGQKKAPKGLNKALDGDKEEQKGKGGTCSCDKVDGFVTSVGFSMIVLLV